MVVPIRKVVNIQFSHSSANTLWLSMTHLPSNVNIDDIRERSPLSSKTNSRNSLISLSTSSKPYHEYMELNNYLPNIDIWEPINSSQLFYKNNIVDKKPVSKVANSNNTENLQCGTYESPALKTIPKPWSRSTPINNSNNIPQDTFNIQLLYNINQAIDQDAWDGDFYPISIHGLMEYLVSDIKNIMTSFCQIKNYIFNKKVEKGKVNDLDNLKGVGKEAWNFISAFYDVCWDTLIANSNSGSFRNKVVAKFMSKINTSNTSKGNNSKSADKPVSINRLPLLIPAKSSNEINEISKYFKKNDQSKGKMKSYAQATTSSSINNTRKVLKIKETFPNLQANKIKKIQQIIKGDGKLEHKLNMMTKGLLRKQIIIPMNNDNRIKFVAELSTHISNINRVLKNLKSDIKADFLWVEQAGIVIVTNKIASPLDLQTIENYIKNANQIEVDNVEFPHFLQLKSYLKIIKYTNTSLSLDVIESIIKSNYIFNNIAIVSRPRVIKVSPRLDMAIIWLDIWDMQSSSRVKGLISRCFNVRSYIVTIWEANINPGIHQCKNCWKWGHTTFLCRIQESRYIKCNSPHKTEHYCYFIWCCKANPKTNLPRLETKQGNLCSHTFKYLNFKDEYQADLNQCPFWRHHFNKE